ncbi:TPA: hypothetical protein JS251_004020 [Escherichia coli]|nr:hypothetical protein [Escherichia coli]
MSLSAYNSSSREGAPRLSMLAAIIGALFSNAYASTAPIDIDNTVQVKKEQIDIDTGSNTGSDGYAISITNSGKLTTKVQLPYLQKVIRQTELISPAIPRLTLKVGLQ